MKRLLGSLLLRYELRNGLSVHVGKPHLAAVEQVGEAFMIHAHQVQHGGVHVVIGERLLGRLVAEIVR